MLNSCLKFVVLLATCTLFQSRPSAADDGLGTLAILSANQQAQAVADLLRAEFSKAGGIELVERDRINAVLKELNLNAAGLVSLGERARLGAIVAADVVLFIEHEAKVQPPLLRISAVESRTGVSLLELLLPNADMDAVTSTAVQGTRKALSLVKTQDESRLFIAFTGVRSEEPGSYLLPAAEALTALMQEDLHRTPGVFLLERSRLQHLTAERDLNGFDLTLKASALLADAGIRRQAGGGGYDVAVRVTSLDGRPVRTNSIEVASLDLVVVRRKLHAALISALGAARTDTQPESAVQEAIAFARRAEWLGIEQDYEEAICAAESAFALDPQPEHCKLLHRVLYSF